MADLKHVALPQDVHKDMKQAALDLEVPIQELASRAAKDWLLRYKQEQDQKVAVPA